MACPEWEETPPEHGGRHPAAAAVTLGIANGADVVRVHDVLAMTRVVRVADAIVHGHALER